MIKEKLVKNNNSLFLKIKKNWAKLSGYGLDDDFSYIERIRVRVLNQAIIIVALIQSTISISHLYYFQLEGLLSGLIILGLLFFLFRVFYYKLALGLIMVFLLYSYVIYPIQALRLVY